MKGTDMNTQDKLAWDTWYDCMQEMNISETAKRMTEVTGKVWNEDDVEVCLEMQGVVLK
jgi:hypothetical protein